MLVRDGSTASNHLERLRDSYGTKVVYKERVELTVSTAVPLSKSILYTTRPKKVPSTFNLLNPHAHSITKRMRVSVSKRHQMAYLAAIKQNMLKLYIYTISEKTPF